MLIIWNDDLITGDRLIDDQHRRLFQLFNDLGDAVAQGNGGARVNRTLAALSVYVVAHFRMEEELMEKVGYPGLAAHRAEHEAMRIHVEDMVDQYTLVGLVDQTNPIGLDPAQVLGRLKQWLIDHVRNQDLAMAQFLKVLG